MQSFVQERVLYALFIPLFNAISVGLIAVKPHVLPVSVVPTDLLFRRFIDSSFFHHDSNLFNRLIAFRLVEYITNVGMFLETCVEEFEHV